MILVPDRLVEQPNVVVYYKSPGLWLLHKESQEPILGRQSYISMPVFSLVKSGEQHIYTDEGEKIIVGPGKLVFLKKGIYTINDLLPRDGKFEAYLFYLAPRHLPRLGKEPIDKEKNQQIFLTEAPLLLFQFWDYLYFLKEEKNIETDQFLSNKAIEYLELLHAFFPSLHHYIFDEDPGPEKNIRAFMEAHYDQPLTVEDYAYLTGRNPSTFRREFKTKFGQSPRQWIIQKRMKKAHQLLQKTEWEVSRIALEVGYQNSSHFISAFKKTYGFTPGQSTKNYGVG